MYKPSLNIDLFPQNIKGFKYPNSNSSFIDFSYQIQTKYENQTSPFFQNVLYTYANNPLLNFLEFKPLKEYIEKIVEINYNFKCIIEESWLNIYSKNGYSTFHNHAPCPLVGVYYLRVPKIYPGINIHNNANLMDYYNIPLISNTLLFFNGDQYHSTYPNPTDEEKIIIAFNLKKVD
tara:strand:- start:19 stop:549 length:531 start_codon:yes stop_codon:yes gene_type:complete